MIRYLILSILLLQLSTASALPPIFPLKGSHQPAHPIGHSESSRHFGASGAAAGCRNNADCQRRQWCNVANGECMSIIG